MLQNDYAIHNRMSATLYLSKIFYLHEYENCMKLTIAPKSLPQMRTIVKVSGSDGKMQKVVIIISFSQFTPLFVFEWFVVNQSKRKQREAKGKETLKKLTRTYKNESRSIKKAFHILLLSFMQHQPEMWAKLQHIINHWLARCLRFFFRKFLLSNDVD